VDSALSRLTLPSVAPLAYFIGFGTPSRP